MLIFLELVTLVIMVRVFMVVVSAARVLETTIFKSKFLKEMVLIVRYDTCAR